MLFPLSIQTIGILFTALLLDGGQVFHSFIGLSVLYWFGVLFLDTIAYYSWKQDSSHDRLLFVKKIFIVFYNVIILKWGLIIVLLLSFFVHR